MPNHSSNVSPLTLQVDRFDRHRSITWWDQEKLAAARVMVIGAGALGNEVIKNLALLGIGHLVIVDMDTVEESNLSRSVLFRESDRGHSKVHCAARSARELYPAIDVSTIEGNVLSDVGSGFFRWADVVIGALDNREARVFVNKVCAQVGTPWIDGGIDVFNGIVRVFAPPQTPCYECTMSKTDWDILDKRRSCSLLAQEAGLTGHVPTTATIASVIGALQAQETVKLLHHMEDDALLGKGFIFDGQSFETYTVNYSLNPHCPHHETPAPIETVTAFNAGTTLKEICAYGKKILGGCDALDFERDMVRELNCPGCGVKKELFSVAQGLRPGDLHCSNCQSELQPLFFHSLSPGDTALNQTVSGIGLPPWDILWVRYQENYCGIEIAGGQAVAGKTDKGKEVSI